jgi:hypothetical protein
MSDAGEDRYVEDDIPELVAVAFRALERSHRAVEALGDQLPVEDRPVVEDGELPTEAEQRAVERLVVKPPPRLAVTVPSLELSVWTEYHQSADAVDLRLDRET